MYGKRKPFRVVTYFEKFEGRLVEIGTRYLQDNSYLIYRGTLAKKERDFVYLTDGEIFKVASDKQKLGDFKTIALNKAIISWIKLGD